MRGSAMFIALVAFPLSLSLAVRAQRQAAVAEASVQAPVYQEGERWVFRMRAERKLREDSDYEIKITRTKDGFESESDEDVVLEESPFPTVHIGHPQRKWIDFPVFPGKKWRFKYPHEGRTSGRFSWRPAEVEVVGLTSEPIVTPAGKFPRAIEIRRKDVLNPRGAERKYTYFYSPETKSVAKLVADTYNQRGEHRVHYDLELIKYSPR